MKQYEFTKKFTLTEEDLIDLLCCCVEGGSSYWCCIDNDTSEWDEIRAELPDGTFEDRFWGILKKGQKVRLIDQEDDGVYHMSLNDYLKGIQLAIDNADWNGDIDTADGIVGDVVFQYALFDNVIYG